MFEGCISLTMLGVLITHISSKGGLVSSVVLWCGAEGPKKKQVGWVNKEENNGLGVQRRSVGKKVWCDWDKGKVWCCGVGERFNARWDGWRFPQNGNHSRGLVWFLKLHQLVRWFVVVLAKNVAGEVVWGSLRFRYHPCLKTLHSLSTSLRPSFTYYLREKLLSTIIERKNRPLTFTYHEVNILTGQY